MTSNFMRLYAYKWIYFVNAQTTLKYIIDSKFLLKTLF